MRWRRAERAEAGAEALSAQEEGSDCEVGGGSPGGTTSLRSRPACARSSESIFCSEMIIMPLISSKCFRLWVISGTEWRTAQAAIHRSLSAIVLPFGRAAFMRPYVSQTA